MSHRMDKSQTVVSELQLGTVLLKTPIRFYPFSFRLNLQLPQYFFPGLYKKKCIVLQQSPDQHIFSQPYPVLPRTAQSGISHISDGFSPFLLIHFRFHQQKNTSQHLGHTNLVIPPIPATKISPEPISQCLLYLFSDVLFSIISRNRIPISFCQTQQTFGVKRRLPTTTTAIFIKDVRPIPFRI
ncbi:unknown [Odoribacter laneus CAG:561]|nr:unknown [Odoribacter laneus CAG:561]